MLKLAFAATTGLLFLGACSTVTSKPDTSFAVADMVTPDGASAGRATLSRSGDALLLKVDVAGATPGTHGLHLHAVGKCEGPKFASATGHLNPAAKLHGTLNPQGSHLGDLPNIEVRADGTGSAQATLVGTAVALEPVIFDADETSLIVHATADDYRTDPSGNSGDRIICGVFRRPA